MKLRIFDICRQGTHVLGPGNRYVIWVQGCEQHCAGCLTPESRPKMTGTVIEGEYLAADIILSENIDGITLSGGEPFLQSLPLADMLQRVKAQRPELTVIAYTGYPFASLVSIPHAQMLINSTDVIIDGPYIPEMNNNKGIRGSSNQRIIPITHRLDNYLKEMAHGARKVQYVINHDRTVSSIGIPVNQ